MKISFVQAVQWVGAAMGIALMVGLNFDYDSEAGMRINAPVEDPLSQGLLGYWKMDEGTGTSVADSSGNANNLAGTVTGSVAQTDVMQRYATATTANAGTVSSTITVPSDAELIVVGVSGYRNEANYFSGRGMTFTKGGADTAMTAVQPSTRGDGSTSYFMSAMFYLVSPDTGSNKTLKWDWQGTGTAANAPLISVTFWKGINTGTPVRGSGGGQAVNTPYTTSTITAQAGDIILAWVGGYAGSNGTIDSWSNVSELSEIDIYGATDGAWATGTASGNMTVAASTDTNFDDGGIVGISLIPASITPVFPSWVTGQIGPSALDFNGTDEWLTVADPSSGILDFADVRDFSISGWFNRDTENTLDTVVAKRNGDAAGDTGYMIWLGTDDFLNFEISDGTDQYAVASSTIYATTGWHQFVATWKDSLGMYLYVDGALVGSTVTSTSSIGSLANAVAFRVGAESSTGTENPFDGKIDDVKLYGRALSENEVSRLYQTTVPGSPIDTGLVGHWTFDGNDVAWGDTSSEIKDVSGKGNHGDAAGSLATTSVTPGKLGQGLSFNGTSDYVQAPDPPGGELDFGTSTDFTITAWIKSSNSGSIYDATILSKGYILIAEESGFTLGIDDTTNDSLEIYVGNTHCSGSTDLIDGNWHFVVVVVDRDTALTGYADMNQECVEGSTLSDISNTTGLNIGRDFRESYSQLNCFPGSIDDVRIYNRALSATEIAYLYNLGR